MTFAIIEVDDGLTIVEVADHQSPEDAAVLNRGTLVDAGPYATYEEAVEALAEMSLEEESDS